MEFLLEFLLELIWEGSVEASRSSKVPRWIRILLIVLLSAFVSGVLIGVGVAGVYVIVTQKVAYSIPLGIVILVMDAVLWMSACFKVRKYLKQRRENSAASNTAKGENE